METNVSNERLRHSVEETIVYNDHQRGYDVVTLRKLRVSNIVFTNLVVFNNGSSIIFVGKDLTSKLIWQLIDSISSVFFISNPESTIFVFVITEARQSSVNVVSSGSVKISGFIKVLPSVVSFFLVFDFGIMWNFGRDFSFFLSISLWEIFFIILILFIECLLINIRILQIIILITFTSKAIME
jgi:hypothetical protein